ncbi:ABC transporter substrate-binding protein [Pseudonocardia ailaonensis]|uniref:ABC transporter substrate-binding protein n=1 Tax=Pseudonocardia ailaonensis TaxID=367279 RepID=A0ABN2N586_9PSEU
MSRSRYRIARAAAAGIALLTSGALLAACGGGASTAAGGSGDGGPATITVGAVSNGIAKETPITVPVVDSIRAKLPQAVRDSGSLTVGLGLLPAGSPPIGYVGTDQQTLTGSEPDLARLVAGVLGLQPKFNNSTWENLFVGLDSSKNDIGFSNITVTEQRKLKYDFASYREDNLGFEALGTSTWNFTGDYHVLAGKTIAVGSGTNQEKILLEWQNKLKAEGQVLDVKTYADNASANLAVSSGKIDAYFTPNPAVAYQVAQTAKTPSPLRNAGTFSGAGASLQGLIAATTKKDSGLAEPVAEAINYLIQNGQYKAWIDAWGLGNESVAKAEVNPPGLPITNS